MPAPSSSHLLRKLSMALLIPPLSASGWGSTGHEVVANIAEAHLSPKARQAVQDLLDGESMAAVSTWMDRVRAQPEHQHTNTWHWVTIPDGMTYDRIDHKPEGDVVEAIGRMVAMLRSDTAPVAGKRSALRYLIHMVGDLHQPLHVGNGLDRGGSGLGVRWMGRDSDLHEVWDNGIIGVMGRDTASLTPELLPVDRRQRRRWQRGTPADWAHECMLLRPRIYTMEPGDALNRPYAEAQWPLITEQFRKAGVRLAWLLNDALG